MEGTINVFVHGLQGKTMTMLLQKDSTIDELFNAANGKTGIPLDEMRLISGGRQLQRGQGKTLQDFNIGNLSTVTMVLRLRGGSDMAPLTDLPPFIGLTTVEEDMISLDADPDTPRAVMQCGHVIGRESMKSYCESVLQDAKTSFICPHVEGSGSKCQAVWEFHHVSHVAGLNREEQMRFGVKMAENQLNKDQNIRQCPRCYSYCERTNTNQRVACPFCSDSKSSFEFCWICLGDWSTKNHGLCGLTQKLRILATCGTKAIGDVPNCPSVRACVQCGVLIEHTAACKHMKCKGCKTDFCFICLRPFIKGNYQCGQPNTPCIIASIQTHISG